MRCLSPRTVGFLADGKTISWSQKHYSKEYPTFQLPCSKCIECRLEYARQWAVRCVHEAKMHEDNIFITLTYDDKSLKSDKLIYSDFQKFTKRLRDSIFRDFLKSFGQENWKLLSKEEQKEHYDKFRIGIFVTGEYGEKRKRPHWHAIIFNYKPKDMEYKYTNDNGDRVFTSATLDNLWGQGATEIGSVTFHSAGYVARYAAKKLVHGKDGHQFEPISKKSSKHAIGKKFLERYWPDIFNYGYVILEDGKKCTIPRYYEKWLQKNQPQAWIDYVTKTKQQKIDTAEKRTALEKAQWIRLNESRLANGKYKNHIEQNTVRTKVIEEKFKKLQKNLKGDI